MGCNCGGGAQREWHPAQRAQAADQEAREQSANERIQQARHQAHAQRVWPGEWKGREHTPAQR